MLRIENKRFVDRQGRTVMLRGVNLGGSSKVPLRPNGATHLGENFYDYRAVTFVGRPFPPPEADEHFARLRQWGFNCLRFIVTWEGIEHAGPGQYDLVYLDYVRQMVAKAGEYGFFVFVDPHQDVWSRWSGGDGAPAWTLEKVGFNLETLHASGAAFLHQESGDPYPTMRWTTNYGKLAAATMFTLFFGGNDFAPALKIDGEPVQSFLQRHYIDAVKKVAEQVAGFDHVLGYDTMNEPHAGFIGVSDLTSIKFGLVQLGHAPSPLQSMAVGAGLPQQVAYFENGTMGPREAQREWLNPDGVLAWKGAELDVWQRHGVWEPAADGRPHLLRPDYFSQVDGRPVDFAADYMRPFIEKFGWEIRQAHPDALIFAETALGQPLPKLDLPQVVHAGHWYDAVVLFTRTYRPDLGYDTRTMKPVIGRRAIARSFASQLAALKAEGEEKLGGPTLVGEFGLAYDLNERIGFREGNFAPHIEAFDRTFQALEANLLSGTLWNYTADNDNAHGDQWNGEDLSIFSREQIGPLDDPHDLDAGGRATAAFVRPYPRATAGEPLTLRFDLAAKAFEYTFRHHPEAQGATEIFVPDYHYAGGLGVELSDGRCEYDQERQLLLYYHDPAVEVHTIHLFRQKGPAEVLRGAVEGGPEQRSFPLEHAFVATNGIRLHVVQAGPADGEMVVLLHGFPEFWYGWREQIPFLVRQGYRVVAPDQRGYNLSDKPRGVNAYHLDKLAADVVGLLDSLGRDQAYLVGHDWGAMVAWWLAIRYPTRFKRVVALNVPHPAVMMDNLRENRRQQLRSWYAGVFQIPLLPELMTRWTGAALGEKLMTRYSGLPGTFTAEDLALYRQAWQRPRAMNGMLNWYRAIVRDAPALRDPRVRLPFLLLWGARDVALGREMARPSVEQYCDDGTLVFIEEASHWVQHDEPERVNRYIARFFREEPPQF